MSKQKFKGQIRLAKITAKGNLKVQFVDHETHGERPANFPTTRSGDRPVHKDLITAFNALKGHAAVIGELIGPVDEKYIRTRDCLIDPKLSQYSIVGFKYNGDDDEQTVNLYLKKSLSKGGSYEFELPAVRLYNKTTGGYEFTGNLVDDLSDCEIEIAKYMEGKFADNGQLSLSLVNDEGDVELAEEESEL